MSDSTTVETTEATPAEFVPNKTRGIQRRGHGNWRNVTETRVKAQAIGIEFDPEAAPSTLTHVAKASVDVKFSAGATAAWAVMEASHGRAIADGLAGAAAEWAAFRGASRVWDIDFACAAGFERSPEGAKAFRSAYGLRTPSVDWPTKVSETPQDDTPVGPVIDLETGRIR